MELGRPAVPLRAGDNISGVAGRQSVAVAVAVSGREVGGQTATLARLFRRRQGELRAGHAHSLDRATFLAAQARESCLATIRLPHERVPRRCKLPPRMMGMSVAEFRPPCLASRRSANLAHWLGSKRRAGQWSRRCLRGSCGSVGASQREARLPGSLNHKLEAASAEQICISLLLLLRLTSWPRKQLRRPSSSSIGRQSKRPLALPPQATHAGPSFSFDFCHHVKCQRRQNGLLATRQAKRRSAAKDRFACERSILDLHSGFRLGLRLGSGRQRSRRVRPPRSTPASFTDH